MDKVCRMLVLAGRRRHCLLISLTGALAWLNLSETTWMAELGLLQAAQEARLYQLGFSLLLAACITWGAVSQMGLEDAASQWLDSVRHVLAPLLACAAFMVVGPSLMLLNKHIMEDHDFPYPLTLSGLGLIASVVVSQVAVGSGAAHVRKETMDAVAGRNYWRIVFPIGACRAVTLATGNAVYLYLSLGFIQMLKAFTPAIILVVMFFARVDRPARAAVWCVLLIVSGTLVEVKGQLQATATGLLLMMTSSVGEAIATVMSQKLLQNFKFNELETMYYLSLPSVLVLAVPAFVLEWPNMVQAERYLIFVEHPLMLLTAALLGVGVNFLTLIVVRATSAVTVKILNTLRCIALVAIGVVFYGESHSSRQIFGYSISLVGFVGYNFFQLRADVATAVEAWADAAAQNAAQLVGLRPSAKRQLLGADVG